MLPVPVTGGRRVLPVSVAGGSKSVTCANDWR